VEPKHSLIDLLAMRQGVLSQNLCQHQEHLPATDRSPLNQSDDHSHVLEYHWAGSDGADFGDDLRTPWSWTGQPSGRCAWVGLADRQPTPALVDAFLSLFALRVAVIRAAPPDGLAPPMLLATAKGAPDEAALLPVARVD